MSFLFSADYYEVRKNGISPAQNMAAYLGGSAIQTVGDNPVTAYRQLVQQFAKGLDGSAVDPKVAASEANAIFLKAPLQASLSGLWPRLIGVLFKRIPKFGILLGYGVVTGDTSGKPGFAAATCASILSAPFINPVRMVEKQQRAFFKQTGAEKPLMEIMRESAAKVPPPTHPPPITRHISPAGFTCNALSSLARLSLAHSPHHRHPPCAAQNFAPLFRGTIPLMGHSMASAILGLVGQPRLQKYVQESIGTTGMLGQSGCAPSRRRTRRPFERLPPSPQLGCQLGCREGKAASEWPPLAPSLSRTSPPAPSVLLRAFSAAHPGSAAPRRRPCAPPPPCQDQPDRVGGREPHLRRRHQPALPSRGDHADLLHAAEEHHHHGGKAPPLAPPHPPTPPPLSLTLTRTLTLTYLDLHPTRTHPLPGRRRDGRRHVQVRPRRRLPRPGHRHRQGDRLAHPLPRGPHLVDRQAQGAQRCQRLGARQEVSFYRA